MEKTLLGLVAAGALICCVPSASAASGKQFVLQVLQDKNTLVDVGAPGVGVGDYYVYANVLGRDGRAVGTDGSSCLVTAVDQGKVTTSCVLSVKLPEGQLTAQSLWSTGEGVVEMAVTGGTGAYRGASGTLTCRDVLTPAETYLVELDGR
ncbi:allene oxide cyclase barrel-like domain-containing protein [Actinokineospora bangkokensis]|nr:dirigent protein [Actinokineospora bangkokensis]